MNRLLSFPAGDVAVVDEFFNDTGASCRCPDPAALGTFREIIAPRGFHGGQEAGFREAGWSACLPFLDGGGINRECLPFRKLRKRGNIGITGNKAFPAFNENGFAFCVKCNPTAFQRNDGFSEDIRTADGSEDTEGNQLQKLKFTFRQGGKIR